MTLLSFGGTSLYVHKECQGMTASSSWMGEGGRREGSFAPRGRRIRAAATSKQPQFDVSH